MAKLFPVKWKSLTTAEGNIDKWEYDNDTAVALDEDPRGRLNRPRA